MSQQKPAVIGDDDETDSVDLLAYHEQERSEVQDASQYVDDGEMLSRADEPVEQHKLEGLPGDRSRPITLADSPPSSKTRTRFEDSPKELSSPRKTSANAIDRENAKTATSNRRSSSSSPSATRQSKDTGGQKRPLTLDPMEKVMLQPKRGKTVQRKHIHFDDAGKAVEG
jgi:hypothetical protein